MTPASSRDSNARKTELVIDIVMRGIDGAAKIDDFYQPEVTTMSGVQCKNEQEGVARPPPQSGRSRLFLPFSQMTVIIVQIPANADVC